MTTKTWGTGKNNFGYIPNPPEYDECLGYWDNPDKFNEYNCKTCQNYDGCLKASEEEFTQKMEHTISERE